MSINVMDEYIKLTEQSIIEYMKLIFDNKFDKRICQELIKTYMDIRYYDLNENKLHRELKSDIIDSINKRKEKLIILYPLKKNTIINMNMFFNYILYLDNVIPYKDIEKVIQDIYEARVQILNKTDEDFTEKFSQVVRKNKNEIEDMLNKFESKEFFLKTTNYTGINGVQRVNLRYNFKLPSLYNNFAIEKAYTTGTTAEDKLFVEYYLITNVIIKDLIKGNFKKKYILEFSDTILKKTQKIERLLNIINNSAIQDKLSLKIKYKTYIENKFQIQELIRKGFKFSVILEDSDELTYEDIQKLGIFSYILINKEYIRYKQIKENRKILNKIIEI